MNVELINIGSELMLGRVLNTHQQWLCRRLADLGNAVTRQVAVADTGTDIETAVRESLSRAALVITTGGLGPTSDDITRDLIAQLLGRKLFEDARIVQHHAVAGTEILRQVAEHPVFAASVAAVENQHSRTGPVFQRPLRNQFRRQVIIEIGEEHSCSF